MPPLAFHDSRTGRWARLGSPRRRQVAMYVCGPTVYAPTHVGHARTYLYFDIVRRYFAATGVAVRHLMNLTDVEDKITLRARELGVSPRTLARQEERRFFADMDALGVLRPTYAPRASDFVGAMVEHARRLARTGRVHRLGDAWFYRPPERTRARNFAVATELERHRVLEPRGTPVPPLDLREFLVWRRQEPPEPSWEGPWGRGVPGWHLECYAMADRYLGIPIDLQGGGQDLIFPHHYAQNEIAFALRGTPFSRTFLHTGFVLRDGRKMSKSVGNLVDLGPTVRRWGPNALRWYLLGVPRTEALNWETRGIARAAHEVDRVDRALSAAVAPGGGGGLPVRRLRTLAAHVEAAIASELGTDRAFGAMRTLVEELDRLPQARVARGDRGEARRLLARIGALTGLGWGALPAASRRRKPGTDRRPAG
ncbi:MAG: class I tRNA ligase family protein [Thermoplasmata archaeon]